MRGVPLAGLSEANEVPGNADFGNMLFRDVDFQRHVDYIHWNPVKHGLVRRVIDWPYSSFHAYVRRGVYENDWASEPNIKIDAGE